MKKVLCDIIYATVIILILQGVWKLLGFEMSIFCGFSTVLLKLARIEEKIKGGIKRN